MEEWEMCPKKRKAPEPDLSGAFKF